MTQKSFLAFNPITGKAMGELGWTADRFRSSPTSDATWQFNPWVGTRRTVVDIASDPQGLLILPPGEQIEAAKTRITAKSVLIECQRIQDQRAVDYEQPGGERSFAKIATMYSAATGKPMTPADAALFMVLLKIVRDQATSKGHKDSCIDGTNYMALYAEERLK